jgi:hypothetical protein
LNQKQSGWYRGKYYKLISRKAAETPRNKIIKLLYQEDFILNYLSIFSFTFFCGLAALRDIFPSTLINNFLFMV